MAHHKQTYEMVCPLCGAEDTVPFRPREDTLCRKCHKNSRKHIPRKDHNTRVSFPITCSSCNAYEVLTYRPRVPLTEVLCSKCMRDKVDETSTWSDIEKEEKRLLARETRSFPRDDEEEEEIVDGSKDALDGAESIGQSVYIRTKAKASTDKKS